MTIYTHQHGHGHILRCDTCGDLATSYLELTGEQIHGGCDHHPVIFPQASAMLIPGLMFGVIPVTTHAAVPVITAA